MSDTQNEAPTQAEEGVVRLSPLSEAPPSVEPAGFPDLGPEIPPAARGGVAAPSSLAQAVDIRLLSDIPLEVTVELGRATLTVSELLALRAGSVVELNAASTVDIVVNGRLVARGDVVVVDDSFGVRITEIVEP